jgi:hypothetical protein
MAAYYCNLLCHKAQAFEWGKTLHCKGLDLNDNIVRNRRGRGWNDERNLLTKYVTPQSRGANQKKNVYAKRVPITDAVFNDRLRSFKIRFGI